METRRWVGLITIVGAVALTAPAASATTHRATGQTAAGSAHYAKLVPSCGPPQPGHFSCFAMRRVAVAAGTPGAQRYVTAPEIAYGPNGGLTPGAIAKAYGISPSGGAGELVAIVDGFREPTVRKDLDTFDHHYGLPAESGKSFHVLDARGDPTPLPVREPGWAGEITLDVQTVRGMCHGCQIDLIESDTNSVPDLAAGVREAVRLHADVISNSYGGPEVDPLVTSQIRKSYDHAKTVIVASTGDNGWYDWDLFNNGITPLPDAPNAPASLPTVVAVGATTLSLDNRGDYANEQVWNRDGPDDFDAGSSGAALGASGGGCSTRFPAPPWQRRDPGYLAAGCNGKRLDADVSVDGDPDTGMDVYQTYGLQEPGWVTYGGTSLAAPEVSAFYALAGGSNGTRYPASSLYSHPTATHDIVIGGNGFCDADSARHCFNAYGENPNEYVGFQVDCGFPASGEKPLTARNACDARVGYDGPSGVGTPRGLQLFEPPHASAATSPH